MSKASRKRWPTTLEGKAVLVVGLGRSGIAAARLCARKGATVTVTDKRPESEIHGAIIADLPVISRLGGHDQGDFVGADLVVVSPGVPAALPELEAARAAGVPVISEVELAAESLPGVPMVGITGTNGKSTTTSLVGAILGAAGMRPFTGGNLGRALSEAALGDQKPGAMAVELSSFQLETCLRLRPHVAIMLNLTPDHLDRHGSMEAYGAAKARIFRAQTSKDHAVVLGDDPAALGLCEGIEARMHRFVGGDAPDGGAGFAAGAVTVKLDPGLPPERYLVRTPGLRGHHNLANAAAAVLACRCLEVEPTVIQRVLDSFPGLPHRLERVRILRGVEWINDSKATNVDSAEVALRSFGGGVIWIGGGKGKEAGYESLARAAEGRVKAFLAIGEDAPAMADSLRAVVDRVEETQTLAAAVARAAGIAGSGDVVLLSPACASFDQFEGFEHRGSVFRKLVEALS